MKVNIPKPSPYWTIRNFKYWLEEKGVSEKTADKIHDWLDDSWVETILGWYNRFQNWSEKKRYRVRVDKWDSWCFSTTLSPIILPMLKNLKETKQGAPFTNDEDVPEGLGLRSTEAPHKENEWDTDENHFKRFDWILDEMIWAFEALQDENYEEKCLTFRPYTEEEEKQPLHGWHSINSGKPKSEWLYPEYDWDAIRAHDERICRGTKLFGIYFRALWD